MAAIAALFLPLSCSNIDDDVSQDATKTLAQAPALIGQTRVLTGSYSFPEGALPKGIVGQASQELGQALSGQEETSTPAQSVALSIANAILSTAGQFIPSKASGPAVIVSATNGSETFSSGDADSVVDISVDQNHKSYQIKGLPEGTWTIKASVFSEGDEKKEAPVLTGASQSLPLQKAGATVQVPDIKLTAARLGGTGSCALDFSCQESGCSAKVEWELLDASGGQSALASGEQVFEDASKAVFDFGQGRDAAVPAGVYKATFSFLKNSSGKKLLIYKRSQNINIFADQVTDSWLNSLEQEFIAKNGAFVVTAECLENFSKTTYYVSSNGSDNGTGKRLAPFATVQKAVENIISENDGKSTYRILVSGETSGVAGENKTLVTIAPALPLTLLIEQNPESELNASINANRLGRAMRIGKYAKVSLRDISVRGGKLPEGAGGGILVDGGRLELQSGAKIVDNAAENGGGICLCNEATAVLHEGSLVAQNEAYGNGGGIGVSDSSIEFKGGRVGGQDSFAGNKAENGGGIYLKAASNTAAKYSFEGGEIGGDSAEQGNCASSLGGGVYLSISIKNACNIDFAGTSVKYNSALENGGGIYKAGNGFLVISASEISWNVCQGEGGGIFAYAGKVMLKNSRQAAIQFNMAKKLGGGIKMEAGAVLLDSALLEIKDGKSQALDIATRNSISGEALQDVFNATSKTIRITTPSLDTAINAKSIQSAALPEYSLYLGKAAGGEENFWPVSKIKINSGAAIRSSSDKDKAEIFGDGSGSVFAISGKGDVIFENLLIRGGAAQNGGGICDTSSGTTSLISTCVTDNKASCRGGGIYKSGGSLFVDEDSIIGSDKETDEPASELDFANAVALQDEAQDDFGGGGIYASCPNKSVSIQGLVKRNYSATQGGGIYISKGVYDIAAKNVLNNSAQISDSDIFVGKDAVLAQSDEN